MFRFDRRMIAALVGWVCVWVLWGCVMAQLADAGQKIDHATAVAERVWDSPCEGHVRLRWAPLEQGLAVNSAAWVRSDLPCTITYRDDVPTTDAWFCTITLHEYGHLAGLEHSDNPNSIMYHTLTAPDPRCTDA